VEIPRNIKVKSRAVQEYLDSLRNSIVNILNSPILSGRVVSFNLTATPEAFKHKLGRAPYGAIAIDGKSFMLHRLNQRTLTLSGSGKTKLWVF